MSSSESTVEWNYESTALLLDFIKIKYDRLSAKEVHKKSVWKEIADSMQDYMPGITHIQVESRWKTLKRQYASFKQQDLSLDNTKIKVPNHIDVLESLLGDGSLAASNLLETVIEKAELQLITKVSEPLLQMREDLMSEENQNGDNSETHNDGVLKAFKKERKKREAGIEWSEEGTGHFLELVKPRYERLTDQSKNKKSVWMEISYLMQDIMPGVTHKQVESRWKTLKRQYIMYKQYRQYPGSRKVRAPYHVEVLAEILDDGLQDDPLNFLLFSQDEGSIIDEIESMEASGQGAARNHKRKRANLNLGPRKKNVEEEMLFQLKKHNRLSQQMNEKLDSLVFVAERSNEFMAQKIYTEMKEMTNSVKDLVQTIKGLHNIHS